MCVQAWLFQSPKGISRRKASILDIFGHIWTCWVTIGDWHSEFCDPFPSNFPAPVWSRLCWDSDSSAASFRIAFQAAPKKSWHQDSMWKQRRFVVHVSRFVLLYQLYRVFFSRLFCCSKGQGGLGSGEHGRNTNLNRSHRYSGLMRDTYLLFNISHFSMRGVKRITGTCNFSAAADIRCGFELFPSVLFISCPGKECSNAKSHFWTCRVLVRRSLLMFLWSFWKILWIFTCWMLSDHLVHFLALLISFQLENFFDQNLDQSGPIQVQKSENWKPQIE